ncbi:uncharacterized protein LOC126581611 isoform X2 [Anopheles aquasalis]|uniref:uncharacterized protein LOC126581611 isoform X2 n=1 Tax=Anopheles aquasalis TaxID=42839 RepID=UPI00215A6884|nr:uncharacterized protein LOC126581611 isoform X2 [Anopheles aquasalis]
MVTMRPITVACIIIVFQNCLVSGAENTDPVMVNIQVREPSGIMIWVRDSLLIEMFGIELYVGKHNATQHIDKEPIWDRQLMVNVTSTVDGKFLIHERNMNVELGDRIRYRFLILYNQTVSRSNYRGIFVTADVIQHQPEYQQEMARSKEILEQKILQCVGSQSSEYLFFPLEDATTIVSDPMHLARYRFWQINDLKPVINSLLTAKVLTDGVVVEMRTVIDKLKVLELGREKLNVVGYDDYLNVEGSGEGQY